jgi:hypothetical protein
MISSHTGKMRRTDSPRSNSCQLTIQKARIFASDIIGYLFGYAHLTNTRSLALVGDPDANAYELLFSFSSLHKDRHLQTPESNCDQKSFKPQWNRCEPLQEVEAPDRLCIKTFEMRRRLG